MSNILLGIDIGSSSVKVALVDSSSKKLLATNQSPTEEMPIDSPTPDTSEQSPQLWWSHVKDALQKIRSDKPEAYRNIGAIGISYQMHGLVLLDENLEPIRPAIIWCDSRAVNCGAQIQKQLPADAPLKYGNHPGNFTTSKLLWVKQNEPENYSRACFMLLPGEYIALKLTGLIGTTPSGLSEAILWNFSTESPGLEVLDSCNLRSDLIAPVSENIGFFSTIDSEVADLLGLNHDVAVTYRAGDQPNNALALNVLEPGTVSANAGTSAVIYSIRDSLPLNNYELVNHFRHINSSPDAKRIGALACINGAGSFYRWLKQTFFKTIPYDKLNQMAQESPAGSNGLIALPFGNGAERTLGNKTVDASLLGINFNRHSASDILRAAQEGIAFALKYAMELSDTSADSIRAANTNMFQSSVFTETLATSSGASIELYETDGAIGAALGAGIGAGLLDIETYATGIPQRTRFDPTISLEDPIMETYLQWKHRMELQLHSVKS